MNCNWKFSKTNFSGQKIEITNRVMKKKKTKHVTREILHLRQQLRGDIKFIIFILSIFPFNTAVWIDKVHEVVYSCIDIISQVRSVIARLSPSQLINAYILNQNMQTCARLLTSIELKWPLCKYYCVNNLSIYTHCMLYCTKVISINVYLNKLHVNMIIMQVFFHFILDFVHWIVCGW